MTDLRSPRAGRGFISTAVAVAATASGSALVWQGSEALLRSASARLDPVVPTDGLLFLLLGSVLLGLASLTIIWSPVGVIVAGALHLLLGALTILFPPMHSPGFWLLRQLADVSPALFYGGTTFVVLGIGVAIGAALVAVGIASARSRGGTSSLLALSAVGGIVALAFWAGLTLFGAPFYRQTVVKLDGQIAGALVLFGIALASGLALFASGRSPVGAWIVGGTLTLIGVFLVIAYGTVLRGGGSQTWFVIVTLYGTPGLLVPPGVAILGLALGVTLRNRQTTRFAPPAPEWNGTPYPYGGAIYPPPAQEYPHPNTGYPPSTAPGRLPPPTP